ncbi:MAG: hypothetical protein ACI307_00645, partial [Sodaliphilus sp.]
PLTSLAARRKSRFAEKKSVTPKKNFAYGLQDRIMCGDAGRWGTAVVKPLVGVLRCILFQELRW